MNRIRVQCPNCKQSLKAPSDVAGKPGECPHCACKFRIPKDALPAPQASEARWMYVINNQTRGPVVWPELVLIARGGFIGPDSYVCRMPEGTWCLAHDLPGLIDYGSGTYSMPAAAAPVYPAASASPATYPVTTPPPGNQPWWPT